MSDDSKPKKGIKWGGVLSWTFKFAVLGIVGGVILPEIFMGGFIHSDIDIAKAFLSSSIEFMEPLVGGLQNIMTAGGTLSIDQAMEPINNTFKGIHELFGVTNTFEPTLLAGADSLSEMAANDGLSAVGSDVSGDGIDYGNIFEPE